MKKGDKFKVVGADYHYFNDGEIVTYIAQRPGTINSHYVKNEKGTHQSVMAEHLIPFKEEWELALDTEFDELLEKMIEPTRTEHKPRNTESFTVTINKEALEDDIPFIIDAYYTTGLSLREVGSLLGVDEKTIRNRMKKHHVPTRTVSQAIRAKYSL